MPLNQFQIKYHFIVKLSFTIWLDVVIKDLRIRPNLQKPRNYEQRSISTFLVCIVNTHNITKNKQKYYPLCLDFLEKKKNRKLKTEGSEQNKT